MTYAEHLEGKIKILEKENKAMREAIVDTKDRAADILETIKKHNEAFYSSLNKED